MQEELQVPLRDFLTRYLGKQVVYSRLVSGRQAAPDGCITDQPASPYTASYVLDIMEAKLGVGGVGSAKGADSTHQGAAYHGSFWAHRWVRLCQLACSTCSQ
jgi:hypothetical protein